MYIIHICGNWSGSLSLIFYIGTHRQKCITISEGPNIFNISANRESYASTQLKRYLFWGDNKI